MEIDTLVKPAPSGYADLLARVPDLMPDMTGGADSMSGQLSPESEAARREALQGMEIAQGVRPTDPRDAAPRGYAGAGASAGPVLPLADLQQKPN